MTRISTFCAVTSALAVLALFANGASAATITVHTTVPRVTVHAPQPNVKVHTPQLKTLGNHGTGVGTKSDSNHGLLKGGSNATADKINPSPIQNAGFPSPDAASKDAAKISILNTVPSFSFKKIDPAAKASVVFVDQQNLENITSGMQKGGSPAMALALFLVTAIATENNPTTLQMPTNGPSFGFNRNGATYHGSNVIGGPSSNASNGNFIGAPSSNASNGNVIDGNVMGTANSECVTCVTKIEAPPPSRANDLSNAHIETKNIEALPSPPPANNSATITVKRANSLQYENARWHDWQEQITNAQNELKQLGAQLNAANIRVQRAQQESNNGRQQVENAKTQVNAAQQKLNSLAPEWTEYAETQLQLKNAQQQLNNAEQQLRNAEAQLNAAQTQENTLQAAANAAQTRLERVPYK